MRRLTIFLCAVALAGCSGGDESPAAASGTSESVVPRLGFVTNGIAGFWVIAEAGALDAGRDIGADVTVHMPPNGLDDQKRMLEDLVTKGAHGIAVSPIDPDNQTRFLDDIASQTRLITHDSDAPNSQRLCYVGMDNYVAGRMCGELVKEALPDGGSVFIFIGRLEQDNARRRRQGVIDELLDRSFDPARYDPPDAGTIAGERFTILGTSTDQFDRAKGKANAEDALTRYPDLDCMVGLFEYNPPLCLKALEQAGRLNDVSVVAFDEADQTLQGIIDGTVHGTVVQDPYRYGYESMVILAALERGDESVIPASGFVDIAARQIRRDNVEAFWDDKRVKLGETAEGDGG